MADIVMPRLSDTMEEGTILRWLERDGEEIHRGQELVEIETDKATMVYESDQDGILQTVAQEGQTLAVGELIARVGADRPAPDAGAGTAAPAATAARGDSRGELARKGQPQGAPSETSAGVSELLRGPEGERIKASPLARRIARESGLDLRTLTGSGPGGRIVKADVQTAAGSVGAATPAEPAAATPTASDGLGDVMTAKGETTTVELTRTQQTIARRMAESKATIPHFALEVEVDMEECVDLRAQLKRLTPPAEMIPTYNDMVVKACALALRAHPRANSSYRDGHLQLHSRVNVGVAVATDADASGGGALIVPTVFDADRKALGEIARETRALAARVRDATITPPELGGGTFTVSNLGMFGVRSFTAIINPPQAAILSVGAVGAVPVVREGGILVRHTMAITLACDHRVLYGADAARFLVHIRELLEKPAALTL